MYLFVFLSNLKLIVVGMLIDEFEEGFEGVGFEGVYLLVPEIVTPSKVVVVSVVPPEFVLVVLDEPETTSHSPFNLLSETFLHEFNAKIATETKTKLYTFFIF